MSSTITRRAAVTAVAALLAGGIATTGSADAAVAHPGATRVAAAHAPSAVAIPPLKPGARGAAVTALQQRLNALGYWVGTPTGTYGSQTAQAVMALQKVAGLGRDGVLGAQTKAALDRGVRPVARTKTGHVIEIDKARQVLMVVDGGKVTKIFNTSTGGGYRYGKGSVAVTPSGTFHVWYRWGGNGWQHGKLGAMYRPYYFNGGVAIHGVGSPSGVGARPASHGCARVTMASQDELLGSGALKMGTTVVVY